MTFAGWFRKLSPISSAPLVKPKRLAIRHDVCRWRHRRIPMVIATKRDRLAEIRKRGRPVLTGTEGMGRVPWLRGAAFGSALLGRMLCFRR